MHHGAGEGHGHRHGGLRRERIRPDASEGNGLYAFAMRFTASFLDRLLAPVARTRFDNEPALVQLVDRVAEFRVPRETLKEPIVRAEHERVGAVERAHRQLQATTRALKLDYLARTNADVVPGHMLFPWMLRHSAWLTNRFQPRGPKGTTAYEARNGAPYKSALVAFGEVIMIRMPIDPPGLRRKLDTQWMKGAWVRRMDGNDAHIVITPYGTVTGRTMRRLPAGQRHQPDLVRAMRAEVSHPVLSQAAMLKALPVSVPIRLDEDTELIETGIDESAMVEEQIVDEAATTAAQITAPDFMQIDSDLVGVGGAPGEVGGARYVHAPPPTTHSEHATPEGDRAVGVAPTRLRWSAGALRPTYSTEEMTEMPGDAMATAPQEMKDVVDDVGEPRARCQRIGHLGVAAAAYLDVPSFKTEDSIRESRATHIQYLLDSKSVKDFNEEEARATGALVLSGRFVDDAVKEKSRYCAREFATTKDPKVFAAASDVDCTSIVDILAVKRGYPELCFGAVAAFSQAEEQELVFIKPRVGYLSQVKRPVLWQCLKVHEGRRNGARSWADHFYSCLTDPGCPGESKQNPKSPTLYHSRSLDITLDTHVDDGYAGGPASALKKVMEYLETKISFLRRATHHSLRILVFPGTAFNHVGGTRTRTTEGMWIQPFETHTESALKIMDMENCKPSTSPN